MDHEAKLPPLSTPPSPVLMNVQCVARSQPNLEGVPHVIALISELLDRRLLWDLPRACKLGDVALLRFIASREERNASVWAKDEPLYRPWRFSNASAVAARHGHVDALEWLLTEFDTESMMGKAIEEAAASGHLHVLLWLHDNFNERAFWSGNGIVKAVANNHLETSQWLRENTTARRRWKHVAGVAMTGNIDMLRWLKSIGARPTPRAIANAASHGHLEAAKFISQQWNMPVKSMYIDCAIAHGHLEVASWLLDNGAAFSADAAKDAAANGHLHVLEWFHVKEAWPMSTDPMEIEAGSEAADADRGLHSTRRRLATVNVMDDAAANGHLHIVQWLHDHHIGGCTTAAMDRAASNGHLEVVQWLHRHRLEGSTTAAMDGAAENNHLETVQWIHQHRKEGATVAAMDEAAANGHLEIVQWLHRYREEGCTTRAMDGAAAGGHLDVIKWLHANLDEGCNEYRAIKDAAKGGHFEVVKWLLRDHYGARSVAAITAAAAIGRLDIVQWVIEERGGCCDEQVIEVAAKNGHFDVVLYLARRNASWDPEEIASSAVSGGHLEIIRWLLRCRQADVSGWVLTREATMRDEFFCAQWLRDQGVDRQDVPHHSWPDLCGLVMSEFS